MSWPRLFRLLTGLAAIGAVFAGAGKAATEEASPPRRRALLVAIGRYDAPYPTRRSLDWTQLHCELDAEGMRQVLISKYGLKTEEIVTLLNEQATRDGIVTTFRKHLIERAQPGDVTVVMLSGHGQQVRDDAPDFNGKTDLDEADSDGLDESFVPYDYVTGKAPDAALTNLRDDHLQALLGDLTKRMRGADGKVTGNITCIIDSCHSGTMIRGSSLTKGRAWDAKLDGPLPRAKPSARVPAQNPEAGAVSTEGSGLLRPNEALANGYVMITACQSHESAFEMEVEGQPVGGTLTYNLCRTLNEVPAGARVTYQDVFERVKAQVKATWPFQLPTLEGRSDVELFSGLARPLPSYPRVEAYENGQVTIAAGTLLGVSAKSRYRLYAPLSNPEDPNEKPLAEITVADVDSFRCRGTVPEAARTSLASATLLGAKARLISQYFGNDRLRILLNGVGRLKAKLVAPNTPETEDALEFTVGAGRVAAEATEGSNDPLQVRSGERTFDASISEEPAVTGTGARKDLVLRRSGTELYRVPDNTAAPSLLRKRLLGLWRWRYLNRLTAQSGGHAGRSLVQASVRVVPVEGQLNGTSVLVTGDRRDVTLVNGQLVLKEGDYLQVEVQNTGDADAYVTVLNLRQNGTVRMIFPNPRDSVRIENRLPPRSKPLRLRGTGRVGEPYGTDVFLAIATAEPIDFAPYIYQAEDQMEGMRGVQEAAAVATARGLSGPIAPLARLLLWGSTGHRGVDLVAEVEPGYWSTASFTLLTQPR